MSEDLYEDDQDNNAPSGPRHPMAARFRGYLPVVVDVETGGFNCATDALLEIAATTIAMDEQGFLYPDHTHFFRYAWRSAKSTPWAKSSAACVNR